MTIWSLFGNTNIKAVYLISYIQRGNVFLLLKFASVRLWVACLVCVCDSYIEQWWTTLVICFWRRLCRCWCWSRQPRQAMNNRWKSSHNCSMTTPINSLRYNSFSFALLPSVVTPTICPAFQFYARQHICYGAYLPCQFCPSVHPSVSRVLYQNGWTYHRNSFTTW